MISLGLLALCLMLGASTVYFARAALERADGKGAALVTAAEKTGEAELDAKKVTDANAATVTAAAAATTQAKRGDDLEKELSNAPPPAAASALSELRAQRAAEGLPGPSAGTDPSRSGK